MDRSEPFRLSEELCSFCESKEERFPVQTAAGYRFFWASLCAVMEGGTEEEKRETLAEIRRLAHSAPEPIRKVMREFNASTGEPAS